MTLRAYVGYKYNKRIWELVMKLRGRVFDGVDEKTITPESRLYISSNFNRSKEDDKRRPPLPLREIK